MDFEAELVRIDGRRLPVQVSVSRVHLHDRAFGLALVRDITEQKRLEALLNGQLQILEQLSQGAPLAESLNELLRLAETHSPGLYASILFYDEETGQLRHGAAPSLPVSYMAAIDGVKIGPSVGSCGTAVYRREEVIVEDVTTSPLWRDYQGVALAHGLRSCWSLPIFTTQRRVLGSLALYGTEPGLPQPIHRRLMAIVMHTAATAISRHRMEMAQVTCEYKTPGDDDSLWCDADQIQQVLVALLVNAIEAMEGGGGVLRVAIACSPDQLELAIADSGVGIPESAVAHIFEPFFSTKEKESGVGLGLAIVFGIVQSHAGTIEVRSEPGRGTTFTVKLPRRTSAEASTTGTA